MRKWQDLAAPDDENSWYAVSNMWPTKRGTYKTADTSISTELANNTGAVIYAFAARTLSGSREYVVSTSIYEYSGGSLTDRTGGVTVGTVTQPMMTQYGDVTICVMGAANPTVKSTGGNFSALAGAPQAEIIVVQSNAVVVFNTNTSADGWAASDVGDYTNWATGEAASGRIFTTPGPILAAVAFGNDIIVFKRDAIYRMTYVGGLVKWQIQMAWRGLGVSSGVSGSSGAGNLYEKYEAVACASGIAFHGEATASASTSGAVYLFDGAGRPRRLNPLTTVLVDYSVSSGHVAVHAKVFFYDPIEDMLCLADSLGGAYYYYSFAFDAWGSGGGASAEASDQAVSVASDSSLGVVQGDYYVQGVYSSRPNYYRFGTTNSKVRRCVSSPSNGSCSLQTSKRGRPDQKTTWSRCIPLMRASAASATLDLELTRERDTSGALTDRFAIPVSTDRNRFDLLGGTSSDNFARFRVNWSGNVECDDFLIIEKAGGAN